MSLTFGPSPFSSHTRGRLSTGPLQGPTTYAEPYPRRVRAFRDGRTVLDTEGAWMVHAADQPMALWFPVADVVQDALPAAAVVRHPGGDDPVSAVLADLVLLAPEAVDRWFLEDEPVYAHVRDPYHRVDVLASHRHVRVEHAGLVLAESVRPKLLYETSVPVRYYLPWVDVRLDLLELSATVSECPYKGDGQHWNLRVGADRVAEVAWSLPHPLPEGLAAAEHVCFYADRVTVTVDGDPVRR